MQTENDLNALFIEIYFDFFKILVTIYLRMKIISLKTIFFLLITALCLTSFAQKNSWQLQKETEGVKIYTRKNATTGLLELQMTSVISGKSLASFAALFRDINSYTNWVYSCKEAKHLKQLSETELLYYIKSSFPWPLSDRDFVVKNHVWQDKKTFALHSKSIAQNDYLSVNNGVVRVTKFMAEWVITPVANGKFSLQYTFSSDPGGSVPDWLVNMFIDYGPLKTIKALEATAQKEPYSKAHFNFVTEAP